MKQPQLSHCCLSLRKQTTTKKNPNSKDDRCTPVIPVSRRQRGRRKALNWRSAWATVLMILVLKITPPPPQPPNPPQKTPTTLSSCRDKMLISNGYMISWAQEHMPAILALKRQKQEDQKFKAILGYINPRPTWAILRTCLQKNSKDQQLLCAFSAIIYKKRSCNKSQQTV